MFDLNKNRFDFFEERMPSIIHKMEFNQNEIDVFFLFLFQAGNKKTKWIKCLHRFLFELLFIFYFNIYLCAFFEGDASKIIIKTTKTSKSLLIGCSNDSNENFWRCPKINFDLAVAIFLVNYSKNYARHQRTTPNITRILNIHLVFYAMKWSFQ